MNRVLIAEDHALLGQGLRALVDALPGWSVRGCVATGREAIDWTMSLRPELLLLDLSMPDMDGLDVLAHILRRLPAQKTIALADHPREIEASEALTLGCRGYLLKSAQADELHLAIRTVADGRRYIGQDMAHALARHYLHPSTHPPGRMAWHRLTERERAVFRMIAHGMTNRAAAACLSLSPKTIEKHRATLMRKLSLRSAVELSLLAIELGLIERPEVGQAMQRATADEAV